MKLSRLIFLIPVMLAVNSCKHDAGERAGGPFNAENDLSAETNDIQISREQFESMKMKVGDPYTTMFSHSLSVNGYVEAAPTGRAKITSLISGRVNKILVSSGDKVRPGQSLYSLESYEIIKLQQEYAEAIQNLKLLKADYTRMQALSAENVVAEKDFLKAKSEFLGKQAQVEGLKVQLEMVHINPLAVEKGEIAHSIDIKAPIKGTISRQDLELGQQVVPLETTMEVINSEQLRLRLEVFETSLAELSTGLKVNFSIPGHASQKYSGTLSHVGVSVSPDSRTVECYATISADDRTLFVNNMFVEASIVTCERETLAIPEQALIREADVDYVLILIRDEPDQLTFRKMPVNTGITRQGQIEILEESLGSILLEGVYSLWAEE